MDASPTVGASSEAPWLRNITFHGLLASLTPLIPLPLLDDWAERWVDRRLIRETLKLEGFAAQQWHVEALSWDGREGPSRGCLFPLVVAFQATLYLLKKIFRKLLLFLLVKDCVDCFSHAFHHGYLLHSALERGVIDRHTLAGGERLIEVRLAILDTCQAVDSRPLNQLVRRVLLKSRRVLFAAARHFGRLLRSERKQAEHGGPRGSGPTMAGEEEALRGVVAQLNGALWGNAAYRAELERVFWLALASRIKVPATSES